MAPVCFVIGPFGEPGSRTREWSDCLMENIIEPAIKGLYEVGRTIDLPMTGDITARIHRDLKSAAVVVADLSDQNPNVAYELGIRHALGLPCVLICRRDTKPPFDLRNHSTVFVNASYVGDQYLMADPAKVAAELAQQIASAVATEVPDPEKRNGYRVRAFDWTTTYSQGIARDWLDKQDGPVQAAIKSYEKGGGVPDDCRDDGMVTKFAEYLELKAAASQRYKGQLFYIVDSRDEMSIGFAVFKFPTSTSTIEASGRELDSRRALIKFDQPSRDVQVAGLKVTLPAYEYSVAFSRDGSDSELRGMMHHPDTGTLIGKSELAPRWGLGL